MGIKPSRFYDEHIRNPDVTPNYKEDATFDPLFGFPSGRKERVMLCSNEELEKASIPQEFRDYCAHKYMDLIRCRQAHSPFYGYYCSGYEHAYEHCQYEDLILRMKEFEREKRLKIREKKITQLQNKGINVQPD